MGLGGDRMAAAGCHLYQDYRKMAFMGVVAVLKNIDKVRENFAIAQAALLREKPDVLVLIDYPSFNLKIAEYCRKHLPATRIYYYIPPKVWAWKSWRVHKIAELSDAVLGIFPFEEAFFARYGYRCQYVGNPTMDSVRRWQEAHAQESLVREQKIAVLPGSRMSEITHCIEKMLTAARRFPDYRIEVVQAPGIDASVYRPYLREGELLVSDPYRLMATAQAAIVNSGTATLETALMGCPEVAVYHVACPHLLGLIWKALFSIRHFTLVNIIVGREVIKELIAYLFTADNIEAELACLLHDEAYKKNLLASYEQVRKILGNQPAAETAASIIKP